MEQDCDESVQRQDLVFDLNDSDSVIGLTCRLCANPSERVIGIYSEEGIANELANKMNLYLPVKVIETDDLPLQCCWNCASTVLAWHELVLASVEADKRLRDLENHKSLHDNFEVPNDPAAEDIKTELKSEPTGASLSAFCQLPPVPEPQQQQQQQQQHQQLLEQKSLDASKVKNEDDSSRDSQNFDDENYLETEEEREEEEELSAKKVIKKKAVVKKREEGVKSELEYNFACQFCELVFVQEEEILEHVKRVHPEKSKFLLSPPQGLTKKDKRKHNKLDQEAVNAAKVVIDGRVYYNCKVCGKSLYSPYTYIWHMRIHTGERPFVCDLCGKQFRVSQGLVRHLRETHEGIKNFGCDLCGRMFATRRNVEEHRRIHTNERPYICDLCGKAFKQKASLFVHNRSHTDSFPFRCSYCNQGFRTRPTLMLHVTRHTGEKPYPCEVCGRCFRIKYELKRHQLIHSDVKPFTCVECGLSFRQKRYLRNHNKTNHNRTTV